MEVETNKKNKSDYEVTHRNYLELKDQHDRVYNENQKLKLENQSIERDLRDKKAEAHELRENL